MTLLAKSAVALRRARLERLDAKPVPEVDEDAWALLDEAGLSREIAFVMRMAQVTLFEDLSARLSGMELTVSQFAVLRLIKARPALTQQRIGDALRIKKAKFVPLIHKLEHRRLVSRESSTIDRRAYALHLTVKGERTLEKATEAVDSHMRIVGSFLSKDEQDLVLKSLRRIAIDLPGSARVRSAAAIRCAQTRSAEQLLREADENAWAFLDEAGLFQKVVAMRMAQRAMFQDLFARLSELKLTIGQLAVLRLIKARPALNQQRIGNALQIQKTNLVPLIDKLEACALVVRRSSATDRRAYALHLTSKGKRTVEDAMQAIAGHARVVARSLDQKHQDQLLGSLQKIVRNLPRVSEEI